MANVLRFTVGSGVHAALRHRAWRVPWLCTRLAVSLVLAMYVPMCTPALEPTMPHIGRTPVGAVGGPARYRLPRFVQRAVGSATRARSTRGLHVRAAKAGRHQSRRRGARPEGREWHVKQPPRRSAQGEEGPVEVVLSRVLSGLGYHQPPVYFLRSFTMADASRDAHRARRPISAARVVAEGPRLVVVAAEPVRQCAAVQRAARHSDDVQQHRSEELEQHAVRRRTRSTRSTRQYVVRDLGAALGKTARFWPRRNNIERFERTLFIRGVSGRIRRVRLPRLSSGAHSPANHAGRRRMGRRARRTPEPSPMGGGISRGRLSAGRGGAVHRRAARPESRKLGRLPRAARRRREVSDRASSGCRFCCSSPPRRVPPSRRRRRCRSRGIPIPSNSPSSATAGLEPRRSTRSAGRWLTRARRFHSSS